MSVLWYQEEDVGVCCMPPVSRHVLKSSEVLVFGREQLSVLRHHGGQVQRAPFQTGDPKHAGSASKHQYSRHLPNEENEERPGTAPNDIWRYGTPSWLHQEGAD